MKYLLPILVVTIALQLGAVPTAQAQTTAPAAAYTGHRYPGGPDSLRALVYRSTHTTTPASAGRMLVKVALTEDGQPRAFTLVQPPERVRPDLQKAATAAVGYLKAHMQNWQLGTPDPEESTKNPPMVGLILDFSTPAAAQPLNYADQEPTFPDLATLLHAQQNKFYERALRDPKLKARLASSSKGLAPFVQMQVSYPPAAMRQRQQGIVYAYFEISETGAVERPAILGTAGDILDDEVLRVLQSLPAATAPPVLQGQPARVFYILPVTFKMM